MTSLALLAHPASHSAPMFNTGFYATAATIIPVLLLAVTIQGRTYQLLKALAVKAAPYIAGLTLGVAVTGEIYAIFALYWEKASANAAQTVLAATIFLIAVVAAAAFVGLVVSDGSGESPASQQNTGAAATGNATTQSSQDHPQR